MRTQMYQLSLFGAATSKIEAATVNGDLDTGVQFIGQTQGLISDLLSVEAIVQRVMAEAEAAHAANSKRFTSSSSSYSSSSSTAATYNDDHSLPLEEDAAAQKQAAG